MKRVEILVRDEAGEVISEQTFALEIGSGQFHEIEQAVEALKRAALPQLEGDVLRHEQARWVAEVKKTTPIGSTAPKT
jgi:uncharacterized protein with ACT and thioredoxin-like domain